MCKRPADVLPPSPPLHTPQVILRRLLPGHAHSLPRLRPAAEAAVQALSGGAGAASRDPAHRPHTAQQQAQGDVDAGPSRAQPEEAPGGGAGQGPTQAPQGPCPASRFHSLADKWVHLLIMVLVLQSVLARIQACIRLPEKRYDLSACTPSSLLAPTGRG